MPKRIGSMLLGAAIASLCAESPLRAGNINAAFLANEASLNEANPVFSGPVGGTLTNRTLRRHRQQRGTPDAFAAFLSGATPAGDHDNQSYGNAFLQGSTRKTLKTFPR